MVSNREREDQNPPRERTTHTVLPKAPTALFLSLAMAAEEPSGKSITCWLVHSTFWRLKPPRTSAVGYIVQSSWSVGLVCGKVRESRQKVC